MKGHSRITNIPIRGFRIGEEQYYEEEVNCIFNPNKLWYTYPCVVGYPPYIVEVMVYYPMWPMNLHYTYLSKDLSRFKVRGK